MDIASNGKNEIKIFGNGSTILKIRKTLREKKTIFLEGEDGLGKLTSVYQICEEMDFDPLTVRAGNGFAIVNQVKGAHILTNFDFFNPKVLVVEDLEDFTSYHTLERNTNRKAYNVILKIIKESKIPVVITCNEKTITRGKFMSKWNSIRRHCEVFKFEALSPLEMRKFLDYYGYPKHKQGAMVKESEGLPSKAIALINKGVIIKDKKIFLPHEILRYTVTKGGRVGLELARSNPDYTVNQALMWSAWNIELFTPPDINKIANVLDKISFADTMKYKTNSEMVKSIVLFSLPRRGGMRYPANPHRLWLNRTQLNKTSNKPETVAQKKSKNRTQRKPKKKVKEPPKTVDGRILKRKKLW